LFADLFGGGMGGGSKKGRGRRGGFEGEESIPENIAVKIELEFSEAVNGTSKV
jgi:DnaJ-class molecular chaperone